MDKDVYVKITGYQTGDDGQTDINEEEFFGQYFNKNNMHYVLMEDEKTAKSARYKFNHRFMEVVRNGDIHSKLTFDASKCCEAIYRTPYGRMPFVFDTKTVTLTDNPEEIRIEVCYVIKNNNQVVSNNKTVISIKNA